MKKRSRNNPYPFAPGVIEGPAPARSPGAGRWQVRATDVLGAMALVTLAYFLAGWLL